LKLFQPLIGSIENVELSEMVNQKGEPLGMVPRKLVHKVNLLHRGIGMVVTKDEPILTPQCTSFPELYMHRRTSTKRIFPSLYDMFVGGVSTAKEDSKTTAQREVAEELGLERALTDPNMLSDPLFDCTVCTAYNRCVVTMFCCTFQSQKDSISWQEEEVAWGDFVPYDTIVASADLSIQRLIDKSEWPGSIPIRMKDRLAESQTFEGENDAWKDWDYVPDGLLVWEAWLEWQTEMVKESEPHVHASS
jgi:isopentenyldiphosphate isomerase